MTTTTDTLTEADFTSWLMTAQPGDRAIYHRGWLACAAQGNANTRRMREVVQRAAGINPRPIVKDTSSTAAVHEERTLFFSPGVPRLVELAAARDERGFIYYAIARRYRTSRFPTAR